MSDRDPGDRTSANPIRMTVRRLHGTVVVRRNSLGALFPQLRGWSGAGSNCRLPLFRRDPSVAARRWKESDRPLSWEDCRWLWLDVAGCLLPLAPALAPGIPNT